MSAVSITSTGFQWSVETIWNDSLQFKHFSAPGCHDFCSTRQYVGILLVAVVPWDTCCHLTVRLRLMEPNSIRTSMIAEKALAPLLGWKMFLPEKKNEKNSYWEIC